MNKRINKRHPNRLMQAMIAVSILVHGALLLHIAGIYRSESLTVIELSMKDTRRPQGRIIPRPRMRPEPPSITEPSVQRQRIPRFALPPEENALPNSLMETISAPVTSADTTEGLAGLFSGDGHNFFSQKDYYDLIRLKIEQAKVYPEKARARMIEGRATVRFTITPDGQVSSVHLVKYSGNRSLDRAALSAVQHAAPFSRPPAALFSGPIHMELTISFELT